MNKIQKRELVRSKRLQQAKNNEVSRAAYIMGYAGGAKINDPEFNLGEYLRTISIRVLRRLAQPPFKLDMDLSVYNSEISVAAQSEIVERTLLRTKGHAKP